jgi:ATP-dependent RNA helicase DDX24/MAK5
MGLECDIHRVHRMVDDNNSKGKNDGQIKALKRQLSDLLSQPLIARGISAKFITSGSRAIVNDLLRGESAYSVCNESHCADASGLSRS